MIENPSYWLENWPQIFAIEARTGGVLYSHLETLDKTLSRAPQYHPIFGDLLKLNDRVVMWALAKNQNTPVPILEKIAHQNRTDYFWALAKNLSTPAPILGKIVEHCLKTPETFHVMKEVTGNFRTPESSLELVGMGEWYNQQSEEIQKEVALALIGNSNTPQNVIEAFVGHKHYQVRQDIVCKRSVSDVAKTMLRMDADPRVQAAALEKFE